MSNLPNISIVTILHDFPQLYTLFDHHWKTIDYPKDKLEWIIVDDSKEDYSDLIPIHDNILYIKVSSEEYLEKINFNKDDDKIIWNYHKKMGILPAGFMRDYAVGLTSNDYIIHFDIDTLYQPQTIKRKLRFLKDNKLECVYCKSMLSYDIYGKQLYKVDNKISGFESTLFHTKEIWKRGGFKWEDTESEAIAFYHGKGHDRKMDNYYDSIKLLHISNFNKYNPIKIELENINIEIPSIISQIEIQDHPLSNILSDLFFQKNINVLGINSILIDNISQKNWNSYKVLSEKKEKKLIKEINIIGNKFDLCFINTNFPIWNIFDSINFDCIVLETEKNIEQMKHILKGKNFKLINSIFINKDFLDN